MKGIDISNNNEVYDFSQLSSNGIKVIIIKATEGVDYVDNKLESNYQGAIGRGLHIGFYHFMSEKTSPTRQAEDFYSAIKDKQYDIIPILDIENNLQGRNATQITDRCLEFLGRFKELSGIDCMVYTGGYFGRDNLDSRIKGYKGWIAHYGVDTPMETGFTVVGHQYTDKGLVSGIRGNVDLNNFTDRILLSNMSVVSNVTSRTVASDSWIVRLQNECNAQGFSNQIVDGIAGKNTLAGCPLLKQGSKGNITKLVQEKLGICNDGIFGNQTRNAVINFQSNNGLVADGIVGQNTWRKLLGL